MKQTQTTLLGDLELALESATKHYKRARAAAERANIALADAEEAYGQARRALVGGVSTVQSRTKLPL